MSKTEEQNKAASAPNNKAEGSKENKELQEQIKVNEDLEAQIKDLKAQLEKSSEKTVSTKAVQNKDENEKVELTSEMRARLQKEAYTQMTENGGAFITSPEKLARQKKKAGEKV